MISLVREVTLSDISNGCCTPIHVLWSSFEASIREMSIGSTMERRPPRSTSANLSRLMYSNKSLSIEAFNAEVSLGVPWLILHNTVVTARYVRMRLL